MKDYENLWDYSNDDIEIGELIYYGPFKLLSGEYTKPEFRIVIDKFDNWNERPIPPNFNADNSSWYSTADGVIVVKRLCEYEIESEEFNQFLETGKVPEETK